MFDMRELGAIAGRKNAAFEAQFSRFFDPGFSLRDSPNLSGEAYFAEKNHPRIYDLFLVTRSDRRDDPEIHRWFIDMDATGDVDEDILIKELGAHFLFQDSDQQGHAVVVYADGSASRHR